jgi:hypothetical protein
VSALEHTATLIKAANYSIYRNIKAPYYFVQNNASLVTYFQINKQIPDWDSLKVLENHKTDAAIQKFLEGIRSSLGPAVQY